MASNTCALPIGFSRFGRHESNVTCPVCNTGKLTTMFSCLEADFTCSECGKRQSLAELVRVTTDEEFTSLAEMVADRFSNRV